MPDNVNRSLRVFLCHASSDKPQVQKLYSRLINDGVDAWLDKEKLIPGQNWQIEIPKVVRNSDVVIVCLSLQSVNKEGFVQKEIKIALDTADEKPEGTIFIIPVRLENCSIPERISQFHWVDLFSDNGYEWLMKALQLRANTLGATLNKVSRVSAKKGIRTSAPKVRNEFENGKPADTEINTILNKELKSDKQFTATSWLGVSIGAVSLAGVLIAIPVISAYSFWFAVVGFLLFAIERITKQIKLSLTSWIAISIGLLGLLGGFVILPIVSPYAYWFVIVGFALFAIEMKIRI